MNNSMNWEQTEYIWPPSIALSLDAKGINPDPQKYLEMENIFDPTQYSNIKENDVIFLRCRFIYDFINIILPHIKYKFILVIYDGDESFPWYMDLLLFDIKELLDDERIIHIFAQNNEIINHNKVSHIPIGLDYHTVAYRNGGWGVPNLLCLEQEKLLKEIIDRSKRIERQLRIFVDFQHSDTMHAGFKRYLEFGEDRKSIFETIIKIGLVDYSDRLNRSALWRKKTEYIFSVCPHGNGLDTHRVWEDLVLGCIIIVKTSSLDNMYEGLPVVIIKSWDEINKENLNKWKNDYDPANYNREKLSNQYWINKINEKLYV